MHKLSTLADRMNEAFTDKENETGLMRAAIINEVAAVCGIKPPSVHCWLNGKTKRLAGMNLIRASGYFDVGPQWLDSGAGAKKMLKSSDDQVAYLVSAAATMFARLDRATYDLIVMAADKFATKTLDADVRNTAISALRTVAKQPVTSNAVGPKSVATVIARKQQKKQNE